MARKERRGDLPVLVDAHRTVALRLRELIKRGMDQLRLSDEWQRCIAEEIKARERMLDWASAPANFGDIDSAYFFAISQIARCGTSEEALEFVAAAAALSDKSK